MAMATVVSVGEYLQTVYRPDCDYLDGEVVERNVGEMPHGRLQGFFIKLFAKHEEDWQIEALPEQRVQVGPTRYRIPDVTVIALPTPDERIVRTPPVLCIEVLSSEDRMARVRERVLDYAGMGVPTTWVVDPWRREAYASDRVGVLHLAGETLSVEGTPIAVAVADVWTELERMQRRSEAR